MIGFESVVVAVIVGNECGHLRREKMQLWVWVECRSKWIFITPYGIVNYDNGVGVSVFGRG